MNMLQRFFAMSVLMQLFLVLAVKQVLTLLCNLRKKAYLKSAALSCSVQAVIALKELKTERCSKNSVSLSVSLLFLLKLPILWMRQRLQQLRLAIPLYFALHSLLVAQVVVLHTTSKTLLISASMLSNFHLFIRF